MIEPMYRFDHSPSKLAKDLANTIARVSRMHSGSASRWSWLLDSMPSGGQSVPGIHLARPVGASPVPDESRHVRHDHAGGEFQLAWTSRQRDRSKCASYLTREPRLSSRGIKKAARRRPLQNLPAVAGSYSAASLRGGSRAPESWISASW